MVPITENTATSTKIIDGVSCVVHRPYEIGHEVDENESRALNQLWSENVANMVRKEVQAMNAAEEGDEAIIAHVLDRSAKYHFYAGGTGIRTRKDPLETEQIKVLSGWIKDAIYEANYTLKSYAAAKGKDAFKAVVEASLTEDIGADALEVAKENLAAREAGKSEVQSALADLVSSVADAPADA